LLTERAVVVPDNVLFFDNRLGRCLMVEHRHHDGAAEGDRADDDKGDHNDQQGAIGERPASAGLPQIFVVVGLYRVGIGVSVGIVTHTSMI